MEAVWLFVLLLVTPALIAGTAYLVPFVIGIGFIAFWGAQAIAAYRAARRRHAATPPAGPHSPAAGIAWLALPLLAWGTLFWVAAGRNASAPAVMEAFLARWEEIAQNPRAGAGVATDPDELSDDAAAAIDTLRGLCRAGIVPGNCDGDVRALGRDVRFRVVRPGDDAVTAMLEVVGYERRASRFLWIFEGTEVVPVPREPLLRLRLAVADEPGLFGALGAERWRVVSSHAVPSAVEAKAAVA